MATPLVMPIVGNKNIGKVNRWIKSEGDHVNEGEVLAELSGPDEEIKYKAPEEGTLLRIIINENVVVHSGSLLGIIGIPGEDLSTIIEPRTPNQIFKTK
jgi:pyruvate dehydrogenase E2 component (dihydrolipoamide acetyltransferase)